MSFSRSGGPGMYYRPGFSGGFGFFPPVIKLLLISNALIWLLVDVFLAPFTIQGVLVGGPGGIITYLFALWPVGTNFWPWQLFTYMFLHGGFWHLFINMFGLWMFGMELEHIWGSRKFFIYYLLCGVSGGLTHLTVGTMMGQGAPTVGASGALFGVLIAFAMMFPNRPIYLYFLLPVRAKYFIGVYIAFELFHGVLGTADGIAHFAHLGGAAMGALYILSERGVLPFGKWWVALRSEMRNPFAPADRVSRRDDRIHKAKFYDIQSGRPKDKDEITQDVIDAILDKISRGGYQSLSDEEKRILNEASRKIH